MTISKQKENFSDSNVCYGDYKIRAIDNVWQRSAGSLHERIKLLIIKQMS